MTDTESIELAKQVGQQVGQEIASTILSHLATQGATQTGQQGSQQQSALAAQETAALATQMASQSKSDTDVNAEEAMRAGSPAWGINMKMVVANELTAMINARDRYDTLSRELNNESVENARRWATQIYSAFGERNTLNLKVLANAVGQPGYFHENAPAEEDAT